MVCPSCNTESQEANVCTHCGQTFASVQVSAEETVPSRKPLLAIGALVLGGLALGGWMLYQSVKQEEEEDLPEPEEVSIPQRYRFAESTSAPVSGELSQERTPAYHPIQPHPTTLSPIAQKWHEANTKIQQEKDAAFQRYQEHQSNLRQQQRYTDQHYDYLRQQQRYTNQRYDYLRQQQSYTNQRYDYMRDYNRRH